MDAVLGHDVRLVNRTQVEITGVKRIDSFDVSLFTLETTAGHLQVDGDSLHMQHFDVEKGLVRIAGRISGLTYLDVDGRRGFMGRLLK